MMPVVVRRRGVGGVVHLENRGFGCVACDTPYSIDCAIMEGKVMVGDWLYYQTTQRHKGREKFKKDVEM